MACIIFGLVVGFFLGSEVERRAWHANMELLKQRLLHLIGEQHGN